MADGAVPFGLQTIALQRRDDLARDLKRMALAFALGAVVQVHAGAINGAFGVLLVVEGIAANADAALLGVVQFRANLGDTAIAAAGEVLTADDAALLEVFECLIEAVAVGLAGPGGFDGALFGPEAFEFRGGVAAQRVGVSALLADIIDGVPDLVTGHKSGADHCFQESVDIAA
ncbi:MAG: hypothetical protein IPG56_09590 [Caulobacteraceae bacterium]|nr:hypothetical protein [Caulobacteraceae bacterium]